MKNIKILLVDDEPDILEFIGYNLKKEGFEVETAQNGIEGLKQAKIFRPDLILLDVMMPQMDGMEMCTELRKLDSFQDTLVVFLSARVEDFSQLAGYDAGANDYILKPIKPKVLISKLNALLKLKQPNEAPKDQYIKLNNFEINRETYKVNYQGEDFLLPRKEFELIALLASNPERVFKREEILEKVWGNEVVVGGRTIDVHMRKLREKFGNDRFSTIKGIGYKIND
ncbi:response regulator transcription factor [Empedobacter brevis]|uniref:DNA-binding response regulator n=2 Tax=Empedobacter brevis TaxID=247 RepID=A0A511NK21_9FLAO|nr:response regulator transcription factor [Empedobacter brevis]MDM1074299.1 response regulator transcription factor [Empedobacter brevis]QES92076.1 response regulator transcription factor [Empedobacter brevis]QHC83853.1 ArsR family transcriptional regulator [Empedobacter brevis]GEM52571.1 DNA-binding response regulator [Empedobacter brevis NBRC 14943 = ATCC 43319]